METLKARQGTLDPGDKFDTRLRAAVSAGGWTLLVAVGLALGRGYLLTAARNVRSLLTYWFLMGLRPMPGMTLERSDAPRLAYALPIFTGAVVAVWLR